MRLANIYPHFADSKQRPREVKGTEPVSAIAWVLNHKVPPKAHRLKGSAITAINGC